MAYATGAVVLPAGPAPVPAGGAGRRGGDGGRALSGGAAGESLPPELLLLLPSAPGPTTAPHTHTDISIFCGCCCVPGAQGMISVVPVCR